MSAGISIGTLHTCTNFYSLHIRQCCLHVCGPFLMSVERAAHATGRWKQRSHSQASALLFRSAALVQRTHGAYVCICVISTRVSAVSRNEAGMEHECELGSSVSIICCSPSVMRSACERSSCEDGAFAMLTCDHHYVIFAPQHKLFGFCSPSAELQVASAESESLRLRM